jgi:D-3-phosphoglycerate dehydrogenase
LYGKFNQTKGLIKMFKVQTLNVISRLGLDQFPADHYQLGDKLSNPDAILVRSQDMLDMVIPDSVLAIGRAGAGVNNIPVTAMTKRGIPVFNTPGANANAVSELVIAGMLLSSRHLCQAWQYVKNLKVNDNELNQVIEEQKKKFSGVELLGKTLGIVGLGSIGVKVANAALHLGMHVIGYDPTISVNRAWELSASVQQAHTLEALLTQSDFISFHVPLTVETTHMMNRERLAQIKSGAILLNFARDGILDNQALAEALEKKTISAYITDFPCVLLKDLANVISLPHLGASTKEAEENCAIMVVRQIRDYLERGAITNAANFPKVDIPHCATQTRITVVNENIPNMVAQMSSVLGVAGINIVSLLNQSREDIAYTVMDVNSEVGENVLKQLEEIKGVIKVRRLE